MDTLEKPPLHYAGFWRRFAAHGIDSLVMFVLIFGMLMAIAILSGFCTGFFMGLWSVITHSTAPTREELHAAIQVIYAITSVLGIILTVWFYYAFFESSSKQGTLGKMALGLAVVDVDGYRISFWRATGRNFSKFFSAILLCLGYLMIAFTGKKQALHDHIAKSLVVIKTPRTHEVPLIIVGSILATVFAVYSLMGSAHSSKERVTSVSKNKVDEQILSKAAAVESEIHLNALKSFLKRTTEKLMSFSPGAYDLSDLKPTVAPQVLSVFTNSAQKRMDTSFHQSWVVDEIRRYEDKKFPQYVCIVIKGVKTRIEEVDSGGQKEKQEKRWSSILMTYLKAVTPTAENPYGFILSGIYEQENPQKAREIWENSSEIPDTAGQDDFQYQSLRN